VGKLRRLPLLSRCSVAEGGSEEGREVRVRAKGFSASALLQGAATPNSS
jgi:hypothetical protein